MLAGGDLTATPDPELAVHVGVVEVGRSAQTGRRIDGHVVGAVTELDRGIERVCRELRMPAIQVDRVQHSSPHVDPHSVHSRTIRIYRLHVDLLGRRPRDDDDDALEELPSSQDVTGDDKPRSTIWGALAIVLVVAFLMAVTVIVAAGPILRALVDILPGI